MDHPLVITVILNTNKREDTLACLASLKENTYANHKIIVLDNASTDGSPEAIRAQYPEVQLIGLTQNLGYAGNNNVGIQAALAQGADWVFVLNEDTILAPNCIAELVATGECDAKIGIVGPMVYHFDEPELIQSAGGQMDQHFNIWHRGQNQKDEGQFANADTLAWISGCAILLRRQVIEQVGMLDERFFYYWEETEWCLRTRKAGWQVVHVPQAKLWHKGVQRDYQPKPSVTYYSTRNRLLMLSKHRVSLATWVYSWGQIGRTLGSWTIKPQWHNMRGHRDAMWRGATDFVLQRWGRGRPTA